MLHSLDAVDAFGAVLPLLQLLRLQFPEPLHRAQGGGSARRQESSVFRGTVLQKILEAFDVFWKDNHPSPEVINFTSTSRVTI